VRCVVVVCVASNAANVLEKNAVVQSNRLLKSSMKSVCMSALLRISSVSIASKCTVNGMHSAAHTTAHVF
jgi:hypothetical protein